MELWKAYNSTAMDYTHVRSQLFAYHCCSTIIAATAKSGGLQQEDSLVQALLMEALRRRRADTGGGESPRVGLAAKQCRHRPLDLRLPTFICVGTCSSCSACTQCCLCQQGCLPSVCCSVRAQHCVHIIMQSNCCRAQVVTGAGSVLPLPQRAAHVQFPGKTCHVSSMHQAFHSGGRC